MKKYPTYKPSGVDWIGDIPEHWEVAKIKFSDLIIMGQSPSSEDYSTEPNGMPFLQGNADFSKIYPNPRIWCDTSTKTALPGDILVSVRAPVGAVNIADQKYGIGRGLAAIRSRLSNSKFLYFFFLSVADELNSLATGSTFTAISTDDLKDVNIPLPPLSEQHSITSYLDRQTALIDELVQKTTQKIALLREQRSALINRAVTKGLPAEARAKAGLDPSVPMKDSGVEWIGEVPRHWNQSRVKYELLFHNNKRIPLSSEERALRQGEFPYYGASGVIDSVDDYLFDGEFILVGEDGANILSRSTPLAFIAKGKFWVNNHAHILEPRSGNIQFLANQLEQVDFTTFASGSAQPKLTREALENIPMVVPDQFEQMEIAEHINSHTNAIDTLILKEQQMIDLLKEYRQALISEVVTGKMDVRDS